MKRMLLIFFTLVTMCFSDNFVKDLAHNMNMTVENVEPCLNKTNVTREEMIQFDQILDNERTDSNNLSLRIGCLFACLVQKKGLMTGPRINVENIREMLRNKYSGTASDKLNLSFHVLETCAGQVRNLADECQVNLVFTLCSRNEMQRLYKYKMYRLNDIRNNTPE